MLREKRLFWYDAAWRAIAEDVDDDTTDGTAIAGLPNVSGTDRHVQQVFGLRGINDAIYRREDRATFHAEVADNPNTPENEHQPAHTDPPDGRFDPIGSETADMAVYQLADPQGSVVAVLADAPAVDPRLVDEVEYEPYGRARRTAQGDFNHSGSISPQDHFDLLNAYFTAAPAGDENDDGSVSVQDIFDFQSEYFGGDTTPSDRISGWSVFGIIDNPYGYCGYYADHETAAAKVLGPGGGALYSVRFRVYDPIAGRWLTRDPAGFVDGANLYEYCGGGAVGWWDPLGLFGCDQPPKRWNPVTDRPAPNEWDPVFDFRVESAQKQDEGKQQWYNVEGHLLEWIRSGAEVAVPAVYWFDTVTGIASDPSDWHAYINLVPLAPGVAKKLLKAAGEVTIKTFNEFQKALKAANGGKGLPAKDAAILWERYKEYKGIASAYKQLEEAARKAVDKAWKAEQELVKKSGKGTRDWSEDEMAELIKTGKVNGYEGHHINNKADHPSMAGNPNNIEFVTRKEHFERHENNWQNPTTGPLIDRQKLIDKATSGGGASPGNK